MKRECDSTVKNEHNKNICRNINYSIQSGENRPALQLIGGSNHLFNTKLWSYSLITVK